MHCRIPVLLVALACLALAAQVRAADVDWSRYTETDTVSIRTTDEDGSPRDTTIWIVVLDGEAFIRTGGSSWGDNAERNREAVLVAEDVEIPVAVEFVSDPALRERVAATFNEKYGWSDSFIALFRGSNPRIMRLAPR